MIIIEDDKRTLNLNPMVIYLMLTPAERNMHGEKLKGLNNYKSITRGIFHFEIVEKGDTPYEHLPAEMTRGAAKNCNVLVRLINSIHFTYCYGLDFVDLTLEANAIREYLNVIVDNICRKNLIQMDILCGRITSSALFVLKQYHDKKIVAELFGNALKRKNIKKEELPTLQLQKVSATTTLSESNDIAKEALTNPLSERIERELCERNQPAARLTISMYLKNVPNGWYASGKQKTSFGMELIINGDTVHIPITNTDWKVFYLAVAVAKLEDVKLRRKDFSFDSTPKALEWVKRVYSSLPEKKKFDDWHININRSGQAARINDAKSKINKYIWDKLPPQYKEAYYYVFVDNMDQRTENSRYNIHINKSHIYIDDYIMEALQR